MAEAYPVIDGDQGAAEIYGTAETAEQAIAICEQCFADEIARAEMVEDITMPDGKFLPKAWLVLTIYGAGLA